MVSSSAALGSSFGIKERQVSVLKSVLSPPTSSLSSRKWTVLVCDSEAQKIVNTLFTSSQLRSFGVTLNSLIDNPRGPVPDAPALYLIMATPRNIAWLTRDLSPSSSLYRHASAAFLTDVSPSLLAALASVLPIPSPLVSVRDMHMRFLSLEQSLFTLNIERSYLTAVRAAQEEGLMRSFVDVVVDGLFSVLVTLGVIPIIRAQRDGPAEAVAATLDACIRENLHIFQSASLSSRALSFRRPLLLLVDRSLDFNPIFYHTWTYQALVHDCLNMNLNRVTVELATADAKNPNTTKTYLLEKETDSFWNENASSPFPVVAEAVETALTKYRADVEMINSKSPTTSENSTGNKQSAGASQLAAAISSLPELSRQKETIDRHTNIATMLLNSINKRSLDAFFELESQLMSESRRPIEAQSPDACKAAITTLLKDGLDTTTNEKRGRGTPADCLRMFLIYYDIFGDRTSSQEMDEYKSLLKGAGVEISPIEHLGRLKGYSHDIVAPISPSNGSLNTSKLTGLMKNMVNRGYRSITNVAQNAKRLVTEQANAFAVAKILEVFMKDAARDRDVPFATDILNEYLLFDPKVLPSSDVLRQKTAASVRITKTDSNSASRDRMQRMIFSDAIVFTVGGGNYVEFENCMATVGKTNSSNGSPNVLYGTTEMVTAETFLSQLNEAQAHGSS